MSFHSMPTQPPSHAEGRLRGAASAAVRVLASRLTLRSTSSERLAKQLRDYEAGGRILFWQKQCMYLSSSLLAALYYNTDVGVLFLLFMQLAELVDFRISKRLRASQLRRRSEAIRFHQQYLYLAIFQAAVVSLFAMATANFEPPGTHFTPLFYLLAAGLFAAVNNHQLPIVLLVRTGIYALAFVAIPLSDLIAVRPDLSSRLWLQFATVLVVLFFVFECARICLALYRRALDQMDELREERDKAKAAYEVKSQFVSVVSHELRTPLTSILGSLSLLQSGAFDTMAAERDETIAIAFKNSRRLSNLINDLLDLQRMDSGLVSYRFAELDLVEVAEETLMLMAGYAEEKKIRFVLEVEPQVPQVLADHGRIEQVLKNLLSNAVKFSHDGGQVEVRVAVEPEAVLLQVSDDGIGIPEGAEELVFGKFSQVDASDHRSHQGSGLGLNISRQIVDAHSGSLTYRSVKGRGTTFELRLPIALAGEAAPEMSGFGTERATLPSKLEGLLGPMLPKENER